MAGYTTVMDELIIAGKRHISSKRASELTGYAKDYIGQLIRQGKVHGSRVGRAWYVDLDEILLHAGKNITSEPESREKALVRTLNSVPRLTPAIIQSSSALPPTWGEVRYEHENVDNFPQISVLRLNNSNEINEANNMALNIVTSDERNVSSEIIPTGNGTGNNIVRTNSAHNVRSTREKRTNTILKHRRAVISFALLFAGIVAFSSISAGFFVSREISMSETDIGRTAAVYMGFEFVSDILSEETLTN